MKLTRLLYIVLCFSSTLLLSLGVVDLKSDMSSNKIRILVGDDMSARQKELDNLKAELQTQEAKSKDFLENLGKKIASVKQQIDGLKQSSHKSTDFVAKKINQLGKILQVLHDIKSVKLQIIETLKQHVDFWEKYFSNGGKVVDRIEVKSLYTFSDLQEINKKIAKEEEQKARWIAKKEEEEAVVQRQDNQVSVKERELRKVEKEIEDIKKNTEQGRDIKAEIELLDIDKELIVKERELAELRSEYHQKEADQYDSRILVIQERLKHLREDMNMILANNHIDRSEEQVYLQKKNEVRREVTAQKTKLTEKKDKLTTEKNNAQEQLELLSNRFNIPLSNIRQIEEWEVSTETLSGVYAAYKVSEQYTKVALLEQKIQKIITEIALKEAELEKAQVLYETVNSLYAINQGKYRDGDYVDKSKALLRDQQQTLKADLKRCKNEIDAAHNLIKNQYKAVNNLKQQQEKIKQIGSKVSASQQRKVDESAQLLATALKRLDEQKDEILAISELSTKLFDVKEETLQHVDFMLAELERIGVWHRARNAMTWEGIKHILPNLKMFIEALYTNIVSYVSHFDLRDISYKISQLTFVQIFFFFFFLFFAFLLFMILQAFLPVWYRSLMTAEVDHKSSYGVNRFLAVLVSFFSIVFTQFYWWLIFLLYSSWYNFPVAIMLLFSGYSIVFWIYASRVFLRQFLSINRRSDYVLLNQRLVDRFSLIFSFFSVSTIVLLFFRSMFMLVMTYQQSEFPTILLRVYHVVLFISMVFALDKEDLVQLIPTKTRLGQKISSLVQKYYYMLLFLVLGLLVMSDPYLGGYGTLVWYMFWNSLFTIFILILLFLIHKFVRRYTEIFFFEEDEMSGGSSERFDSAKTWYGFYVVVLFLAFILFGSIICANIWGYGLTLGTLRDSLYYVPFRILSGDKYFDLRIIDLLRIFFFPLLGFFVAYLFRRFVLDKIFEINYVDPGVQNTVTIISRYVIIVLSLMVGLAQAGLGNLVFYFIAFGTAAVLYGFKDLFNDSIAYFFILVQRPLKLGDFVKIDNNIMGVVRRISSRSVVLRRKNAVSIVVPNSTILKSSMYNWNYTRTYIGFEDIEFVAPFEADVVEIKNVLFKILDEDPDVLKVPQPIVRLSGFDDKGYSFMVRGFLSSGNTLRQWDITSNLRFAIVAKLKEKGIQIAAPSLEVVMSKKSSEVVLRQARELAEK